MTDPLNIEPHRYENQTETRNFKPILLSPSLPRTHSGKDPLKTKTRERIGEKSGTWGSSSKKESLLSGFFILPIKKIQGKMNNLFFREKDAQNILSFQNVRSESKRTLFKKSDSLKKGGFLKKRESFKKSSSSQQFRSAQIKPFRLIKKIPVDRILRPEIISFIIAFFIFSMMCVLDVPGKIGNNDSSLKRMISLVSEKELDNFASESSSTTDDGSQMETPQMAAFSLDIPSGESLSSDVPGEQLKIKTYRFRAGDSLSLIAAMYGVKCQSVASLNKISDIRKVREGEEIGIPSQDGLLYKIERNDTHSTIADKLNLDGESRTLFLLDYPKLLSAGTEIFVRGAQMSSHQKSKLTGDYFLYPINGTLLTRFGEVVNKRTGVESFSEGIELAAPKGSVASASRSGTVIYSRQHPSLGGCVMIEHRSGMISVYGQLLERTVSVGEEVEQGDSVGLIGNPVFGKGSHLFFSIKKNGTPVDPLDYLY